MATHGLTVVLGGIGHTPPQGSAPNEAEPRTRGPKTRGHSHLQVSPGREACRPAARPRATQPGEEKAKDRQCLDLWVREGLVLTRP